MGFLDADVTDATADAPAPADRSKKEHVGLLDRVIWSDADQPVSILALTDGKTVVVPAHPGEFARGQAYRFLGRWEEGRRGPQFRAATYVHDQPHGRAGVVKYLTSQCGGVGEKTAARLWDLYGPAAVRVLREEPQRVADDKAMTIDAARAAAEDLSRFAGLERTRVDLFGLFAGRGFPQKLVDRAMSKWGARAPDIVRRDPFRLLTAGLPGCGFKRCDRLYLQLGGRRDALKRQFLAGWQAVRDDRSGSTWVDAQAVVEAIRDAAPGLACDPVKAIRLGVRAGWLRIRRDGPNRWLAVADRAAAEQRVADAVARLSRTGAVWPGGVPVSAADGDGLPSAHQVGELAKGTAASVGCFTGGPGTGKTHTLSYLLRRVIEVHGERSVAVAAPTGKAAVRATESLTARGVAVKATTIHRLLEVKAAAGAWEFARGRDNPLSQTFLVVDEASMIDASLAADLLDACADGTQVLFVGDPFQLPPVGHGRPLADLIASGAVGVGELTEVRRNAGLIVRGCAAVKAGRDPQAADRFDLDADDPANLKHVACPDAEVLPYVETVLAGMTRFDPVWDTQIITPLNNKSGLSRTAVNDRLARLLNPDGRRATGCPFAVGDKVICLKNSQLRRVEPCGKFKAPAMAEDAGNYQTHPLEQEFAANGEIGRVVAVSARECVIGFGPDRLVSVPVRKQRQADPDDAEDGSAEKAGGALGDFDQAYAITVHRSQGSEWPCVIALIDPAGSAVADRNFWYTAISRAKAACLLVGDAAAFAGQCRRQSLARRRTFLAELLRGHQPNQPTESTP